MPDEPMFAKLMKEPRVANSHVQATKATSPPRTRQISLNLREDQIAIIDRYFALLYASDARATRSRIVGVALQLLDRVLDGQAPDQLDDSLLDKYVRTYGRAEARVTERT